ncbi:MAG TPA: SDR family NAD(P)-dependent oxidoreductase [Steroidobacteraceae bacterium]|jgi:acetoacetyl-CoA reductase|nr:SDR family NAD(P)-dependent oxidoreductase [Steroidobacteraceae bacterium]
MMRFALVTGAMWGIGAAIGRALKAVGYMGAASYAGSGAAAEKKAETNISVYKWDVASFEACADGVRRAEAELGSTLIIHGGQYLS